MLNSTIFKTFNSNSDSDKALSKIGILGKSFEQIGSSIRQRKIEIDDLMGAMSKKDAKTEVGSFWSYIFGDKSIKEKPIDLSNFIELDNSKASNLLKSLQEIEVVSRTNTSAWQEYFSTLSDGQKWQIDFVKNNDLQKSSTEDLIKANQQARVSALAHNEAIKAQTLSAKAGAAALKALSIAGNMIAMWAISKGLELAVKGIDELAHSAEHCKERVDELMSNYQSALDKANSNAKTIEDLASRYEELSKGVNNLGENVSLTANEYSEYNDIVNQIADMFPTLIQGYTNEGNAILSLKGNVEQLRDAYKEAQQEAYNMLIISGKDSDGNDIIKNWENLHGTNFFSELFDFGATDVGGKISTQDAIEQLKALSNMSAETYRNIEQITSSGTREQLKSLTNIEKDISYGSFISKALGIDKSVTDEDFEIARKQAKALLQTYQAEIDSGLKNVQTLANAYLMTNEDYAQLDEQSKNVASIIVNSIDENIASGFENKESVGSYVVGILDILKDNDEIREALIGLFSLDINNMSLNEAKETIDIYIDSIAKELDEEDSLELKVRLGFDNIDEFYRQLQNSIHQITDNHGIADRDEFIKLEGYTKDFTIAQKELWLEATRGAENATQAIEMYETALSDTQQQADKTPVSLSISETIDQLNTQLKPAFDSLKSAYQDIFTDDEFALNSIDILSTCDSIKSKLDELSKIDGITVDYSAFENFVRVLNNTESTENDVENAFNSLATSITNAALTGTEDFNTMKAALEDLGVVNSEMVAFDNLISKTNALADAGIDLANATKEEMQTFIDEAVSAEHASEALALLQLKQALINQTTITTADDCENLIALANDAGTTSKTVKLLIELMNLYNMMESDTYKTSRTIQDYVAQRASEIKQEIDAIVNGETTGIEIEPTVKLGSKGKSSAKSAGSSAGKSFKDGLKEQLSDLDSVISGITSRIDSQISSINSQKDAALSSIDAQKEALEEAKEAAIEALEAERDARLEVIETQKKQFEEQIKLIDKQIKQKQDEIKAINDAADARKRELDLQKAQYELERMQNQRTKLVNYMPDTIVI